MTDILGKVSQLTSSDTNDSASWWSAMANGCCSLSDRTGGRSQIYRQAVGQNDPELLFPGPEDQSSAEVSSDGAWILYWKMPHFEGKSAPSSATLMRVPAGGGTSERVLDAPYDTSTNFDCSAKANSGCVLSLMANGQLIFYLLDPLQGQGQELARTQVGDAGLWLNWALSPDAKRIALGGFDALGQNLRIIDLETHGEREIPVPGAILAGICMVDRRASDLRIRATRDTFLSSARGSIREIADPAGKSIGAVLFQGDYLSGWALRCIYPPRRASKCVSSGEFLSSAFW